MDYEDTGYKDNNKMKVKLISDFRDYYDHAFYGSHDVTELAYTRMAHDPAFSWPKSKQLQLLSFNFRTPRHGIVKDIAPLVEQVVVYTDEFAHAGEGKIKLPSSEAIYKYPDLYCTEYIQSAESISVRHLRLGNRCFRYEYHSLNDWRSNVGDVEISMPTQVLNKIKGLMPYEPMIAIDFVSDGRKMCAIDLNTAPGLKGTGMEDLMSATDIYDEVRDFLIEKAGRVRVPRKKP